MPLAITQAEQANLRSDLATGSLESGFAFVN